MNNKEKIKLLLAGLDEIINYTSNNGYYYQTAVNIAERVKSEVTSNDN